MLSSTFLNDMIECKLILVNHNWTTHYDIDQLSPFFLFHILVKKSTNGIKKNGEIRGHVYRKEKIARESKHGELNHVDFRMGVKQPI